MITPEAQQKINAFAQQMKANGTLPRTSSSPAADDWYSGVVKGAYRGTPQDTTEDGQPDEHKNILQKAFGLIPGADLVAKTATRAGQAVGALGVKGAELFMPPEKKAQTEAGLQRALSQDVVTPTGTKVQAANKETVESTLGDAVGTVSAGLPSAAAVFAGQSASEAMQKNEGAGEVALHTVGGALKGKILELGFNAVSPYVAKAVEKYGKPLYEAIESHIPETAKAGLKKIADSIKSAPTAEAAPSLVERTANKVASAAEAPFKKAGELTDKALGKGSEEGYDTAIKEAQRKLNPTGKYTPTEKSEMLGSQTTTKGKGMFKRDVPNIPVTGETEALAELHQQGELPKSNTPGQDVQTLGEHAKRHDQNIDEFLSQPENKGAIYNGNDVKKIFDGVLKTAEKDRVFLSGTSEERAYKDVMSVAKEEMNKNPKTMYGLRQAVKSFNQRMEDILGKDIYSEGGTPTTVGKARLQAAKDVRSAMNNHVQDTLNTTQAEGMNSTRGDVFKASLKKEAQLLSARDEIKYRAGDTLGESKAVRALSGKNGLALRKAARLILGTVGGVEALHYLVRNAGKD